MMANQRHQVAIFQRRLVQYRVPLFIRLREACAAEGIDLRVVYGQASASDSTRNDSGQLQWADEVKARWFNVAGTELLWQPTPADIRRSDLLILTQENKILSNYPLLARRSMPGAGKAKVAFWGHGRNLQSTNPDGLSEQAKALLSTRVDWWFAYTDGGRDILIENGYPADRITSLANAIDDDAFRSDLAAADDDLLTSMSNDIDLADGAPLGLYCGALYAEKRVDLLIDVVDRIQARIPTFRLVVIGDGPTRPELDAALASRPWARCVGTLTGAEKAAWFRLATMQLSPGAVGLHVLDSFIAGVPLATTADALHGPEIDYLEPGVNGLLLPTDPTAFAEGVVDVLQDPALLATMVERGQVAAKRYTLAAMVDNFVHGMTRCLST